MSNAPSAEPVAAAEIPVEAVTRDRAPDARGAQPRGSRGHAGLLDVAAIAVPTALAALLAFHGITARSLWLDEAASVAIASQHGASLWSAIAHDGGNMLGYYAFLHVLLGVFGHGVLAIRFVSAVATAATVAITCLIGCRLVDRRVAFAAGLLTAVSLPLVFWGQDARGYAPMAMFVAGSFLAFIALVDRDDDAPVVTWTWIAYVVSTVLAVYMSFVAVLIIPAQLLSLVWYRRRPRAVWSAVGLVAVCCAPLAVLAARRGSSQLFWVPRPGLGTLHQMLQWLTSSGMQPNFRPSATSTTLLVLSGALLVAVGAIVVRSARRGDRPAAWPQVLVLCWLLVPIALSVLESAAGQPIMLARNSIVSLPAVALLLAWGVMDRRLPYWLGWSALGALLALRALQLAPSYGASPENWKAGTSYVVARAVPGDCIAFYPSDGRMAFDYYLGAGTARAPRPVLPATPWRQVKPFVEDYRSLSGAERSAIESACPRLWFVSSHQGLRDGPSASRANYFRYRALLGSLTSAYPRQASVSFGWASPVRVELLAR